MNIPPAIFVKCAHHFFHQRSFAMTSQGTHRFAHYGSRFPAHWLRFSLLLCFCIGTFALTACPQQQPPQMTKCTTEPQKVTLGLNAIHQAIGLENIRRLALANQPNSSGALSRNIPAYFNVRFQMSISTLTLYAILAQNTLELEKAVKTMEYSFSYQTPDGGFQIIVPASLASMPPASETDLASGTAFFLSSVGLGLASMQESSWFLTSAEARPYRERIERLKPQFDAALRYLMSKSELLQRGDAEAPNRLFFDALALQTLGAYLSNTQAQALAETFTRSAMALQQEAGYFKEGTGYDSSYQGVGLSVGMNLFLVLPAQSSLRSQLWSVLSCGMSWQRSRVSAGGEISTQGNARVYAGGEKFLGEEKVIAWKDTMFAFWYFFHLTQNADYKALGDAVLNFYN